MKQYKELKKEVKTIQENAPETIIPIHIKKKAERMNKYIQGLYNQGKNNNKLSFRLKKNMKVFSLNDNLEVYELKVKNKKINISEHRYLLQALNKKNAIKKFRSDTNIEYIDLFDYANINHSKLHTAINKAILNSDVELETRVENDYDDLLKKSMLKFFGENLDNELELEYKEDGITKDIMIQFSVSISHWNNEPENIDVFDIIMLFGEEELPLKAKRLRKIIKSIQQSVNLI